MSAARLEPGWRNARRQRILAAAAELYARNAYHAVTMDDVAEAAGVGKATLYRYFPSKDDLYIAIFDEALTLLTARLEAIATEGCTGIRALTRLVEILVPAFREHMPSFRALGEGHVLLAERKRRLFTDRRQQITGLVEQVLRDGVAAGLLRRIDPALTAHLVIGMTWSAVLIQPPPPAEDLAAGIADMLLHGAIAPSSSSSSYSCQNQAVSS